MASIFNVRGMAGTFEIKKSKDNQFYFVLKAGNHEVILTSEMYTVKASAHKAITSIQENAPGAKVVDLT